MLSRSLRFLRLLGLGALTSAGVLSAQTISGVIAGRVADTGGASLPGAQVQIRESGQRATTNPQGEYVITAVAPGSYTVVVAYLGYKESSSAVTLAAGQRSTLDFALASTEVVELDRVVITSMREGTARALNQQRSSLNLANV
ncbi:MAG: carboxypeptidase-like regulatory domain-containing protein, partial [Rhodoglobus sp.]|nr:carboxypeptidase-like regulatory domain-containing protein [Rhodoglobus sp.]